MMVASSARPTNAFAQATRPAAEPVLAPGASKTDAMPIKMSGSTKAREPTADAAGTGAAEPAATSTPSHTIGVDLRQAAIALGIVLALILVARWFVGRMFAGSRAPANSRTVKVLSRTALAPRQQVLLLQVGQRVIVVGDSNGQLATLANLDDADEVALLVGQLHQEQIGRAASFGGLFGRAERKFEDEPTRDEVTPPSAASPEDAHVRSELSGLVEKVRSIRNQMGSE